MNIRNFSIIAHIDHGKSTLADRILELTFAVEKRKMREQFLDQMDLERERGITIKLQPVRMNYNLDGVDYILNLIDTPGHVDFGYEVSRSLAAVEGTILLVDAIKGIQAQTLANLHLALEQKLVIIPVINKIDLPNARADEVEQEIRALLNTDEDILKISAKNGANVDLVIKAIINKVPPPKINAENKLRALIFDSVFDSYKGVIAYVRIVDGAIKKGDKIFMMASGARGEALEIGVLKPELIPSQKLEAGEIGYIATGFKEMNKCRIGDTITFPDKGSLMESLPGYKEPSPMIFASFYPVEGDDFDVLKDALSKLKLNDASLSFEPESSLALGRGFKCGFLGMLHMEIASERLRREYDLNLIVTTPSVVYQILTKKDVSMGGEPYFIYSPLDFPDPSQIGKILEPWVRLEIITPNNYLSQVMQILQTIAGEYRETMTLSNQSLLVVYETSLREIIIGSVGSGPFYDRLKSITSGYASMNYSLLDFRAADLVKLDILIAGEKIEAFSRIVPREKARYEGKVLVEKLKKVIPPQLFVIAIQAAIGGDIVARETISALKKDVTGYLYGGDYSRKKKLLEKQKRGKKKMKNIGKVRLPQEVFLKVLKH